MCSAKKNPKKTRTLHTTQHLSFPKDASLAWVKNQRSTQQIIGNISAVHTVYMSPCFFALCLRGLWAYLTASRTHEKVRSAARVRSLASPGRLSVSICSGEDLIPGRTCSKVCQNVCVFGSWKPASAHADIHLSVLSRNGAHTAQSQTLTALQTANSIG